MKRIIFAVALFVCFSLLCAFAYIEPVNDTVSVQPAPTIVPVSEVYVGMTVDEFSQLYTPCMELSEHEKVYFEMGKYVFVFDDYGNPVVVTFDLSKELGTYTITSVVGYDKGALHVTEEAFRSIEKGMTMHEVVALVGNPDCFTADGVTLVWVCNENLNFHIIWGEAPDDPKTLIVRNVYQKDLVADTYKSIFG